MYGQVTIRVGGGFRESAWELECTGHRKWVEQMIKKWIPKIKVVALEKKEAE